jgi:AcrR family transcriptional regulator
MPSSEHEDFDQALIKGAFDLAARDGWPAVSVAGAAREAGVAMEEARVRFPSRGAILLKLGQAADRHALSDAMETGDTRERLFDMIMRRFDVLQQHRAGVLALLKALPAYPGEALLLSSATAASMAWMLEAAGASARGLAGSLRVQGLVAVWLYTLRAWQKDDSADLSGTMAALDRGLQRAVQAAGWFGTASPAPAPKPFPDPVAVGPNPGAGQSPASQADLP